VREWWNQDGHDYASPQEHLTESLGLGRNPSAGEHLCGDGWLILDPSSPADLAHDPQGWARVLAMTKKACQLLNRSWSEYPTLALRRGPYVVAAGMDEVDNLEPEILAGSFVNLFDARLGLLVDPVIRANTRWLLYDLERCSDHPGVIAAAGRIRDERFDERGLTFVVESMAKTTCAVRAILPTEPSKVSLRRVNEPSENVAPAWEWDAASHTVLLRFAGDPRGIIAEVNW